MDELTENLQKLNLIKAKFDQNKEISKNNQIYSQPGSNTKKAPGTFIHNIEIQSQCQ